MLEDTPKLVISPDFTLDDIRAIRTYNYEITKNMTDDERRIYRREKRKKAMEWFHQSENENTLIAAEPEFEYKIKQK